MVDVIVDIFPEGLGGALGCPKPVLDAGQTLVVGGGSETQCVEFCCNIWGSCCEGVGDAGFGRGAVGVGAARCRFEGLAAVGDGGEELCSLARSIFSVEWVSSFFP